MESTRQGENFECVALSLGQQDQNSSMVPGESFHNSPPQLTPQQNCPVRMSFSFPSHQLNNNQLQGNINCITAFLESIPYFEGQPGCFFIS